MFTLEKHFGGTSACCTHDAVVRDHFTRRGKSVQQTSSVLFELLLILLSTSWSSLAYAAMSDIRSFFGGKPAGSAAPLAKKTEVRLHSLQCYALVYIQSRIARQLIMLL